jgi:6-phosphogluconolactonase (cycloisomerase 2 family)
LNRSGDFLVVANQKSKNLVVFKRNAQSGLLRKMAIVQFAP